MTKILLASALTLGFATSAFATDSGLANNGQLPLVVQQQQDAAGAYAYAPAAATKVTFTAAESRDFDRVPASDVSSR